MAANKEKQKIVIIGGGIIGSTTAYFLSHHPTYDPGKHNITLLEATKIAGGASGKAGGLLALWAYPSCLVPLSYELHRELAEKHGGAERWGYRAVHCGQIEMKGVLGKQDGKVEKKSGDEAVSLQKRSEKALGLLRAAGVPKELDWVAAEGIQNYDEMGDPSTTAQVHPHQFTTSMADLASSKGVNIIYGSAVSIDQDSNKVTGVTYKPKDSNDLISLQADTVILTAGPWTPTIYPQAPISALRVHSVTIRPSRPVSAYALFTSISIPRSPPARQRTIVTPEIYARPNNEVYACGEGDHFVHLPPSTDLVECDEQQCQDIVDQVGCISAELRHGQVMARQACYLPNVQGEGGPLIGETSVQGLLLGAGHSCWGICNSTCTGKVLSELVLEGSVKSAQIESLDPRRMGM